jgi:hypothetical protein
MSRSRRRDGCFRSGSTNHGPLSAHRATRGLVHRGLLVRLQVVPVDMWVFPRHAAADALWWPYRERRFVTLSANPVGLTLRGNQVPADSVYR